MRQTLFHIPHEIAGLTVFGFGWLLIAWLIVASLAHWSQYRKFGWGPETRSSAIVLLVAAAAIAFVLPRIEEKVPGLDPNTLVSVGIPIRGYGVMFLVGVVLGVALAVRRAGRVGIEPDEIFGLAFAMFVTGVIGARLFYVIEYWDEMRADSFVETLVNIVNVIGGGLVVYGSLIGAAVGFVYYARKHGLPLLKLADLIAPSLALGLSMGRLGCLMNGCCFGEVCQHAWAVTFPQGSPVFIHQQGLGMLHGIRFVPSADGVTVGEILSDSVQLAGVSIGDQVVSINNQPVANLAEACSALVSSGPGLRLGLKSGRSVDLPNLGMPARSLPVHPTQIYSSIDAFILFLISMAFYPFRTRDGQVIALLLSLYAVTRFVIEELRTDELGFMGTGLTISQNISILMAIAMVGLWWYIFRQPRLAVRKPELSNV